MALMIRRLYCVFLLLLVWGCTRENNSALLERAAPAQPDVSANTLVRRIQSKVVTLNVIRAATIEERYVATYLFTPIVYLDKELRPTPGLGKSWAMADDGRTLHLTLDPRATFSDGSPVQASDVLFTLRKITDDQSEAPQISGLFDDLDLERTKVLDDHRIDIAFHRPLAAYLTRLNRLYVLPQHVYEKGAFNLAFNNNAVGSGPYVLKTFEPGKRIVLERRNDYWGEKPPIATVIFKMIDEPQTAWLAIQEGEIDETMVSSDTWFMSRNDPAIASRLHFERFYTLNYNFITWNARNPIFADKRVRRALAMCVPTDTIIQTVYHGTARPLTGPFAPETYAYNHAVAPIPHDLAGARQLLAAAGWHDNDGDQVLDKDGVRLAFEMLVDEEGPGSDLAAMLQAELKKVGVSMSVGTPDSSTLIDLVLKGNYAAAFLGRDSSPEPDPYSVFHSSQFPPTGQNFAYYSNPDADQLMVDVRHEMDPKKREALYHRLHQVLADDQPYTWLLQAQLKWAISNRVRGAKPTSGYGLFRWYPGELGWSLATNGAEKARVVPRASE